MKMNVIVENMQPPTGQGTIPISVRLPKCALTRGRYVTALPARSSRITSHELRVTAFLIYRAAIRIPPNSLKT